MVSDTSINYFGSIKLLLLSYAQCVSVCIQGVPRRIYSLGVYVLFEFRFFFLQKFIFLRIFTYQHFHFISLVIFWSFLIFQKHVVMITYILHKLSRRNNVKSLDYTIFPEIKIFIIKNHED